MKKFRFRLERVLEYRKLLVGERLRELLKRTAILRQFEQQLAALQQELLKTRVTEGTILSAVELELVGAWEARLREAIAYHQIEIERAKEAVEEALKGYIEATKDEKALVMLKDKKRGEYMEYIQAEQQKFLDEISIQKGNPLHRRGDPQ